MLSNPHWNAPSVSSFEHWLEGKDPKESYAYSDCARCACAQYLRHVGKYEERWLRDSKPGDTFYVLNRLAAGDLSNSYTVAHTYGDLLGRVRSYK